MPDVDTFARYDPFERRLDDGVAQVKLGSFQRGLSLLHDRPIVARMVLVGAEGGLGLHHLMLGQRLGSEADAQRGGRLIVELTGDHAPRLEFLGPVVVETRLVELRLGELKACLCGVDLRVKLVDGLTCALELGLGLIDPDLVVARVELQQRVVGFTLQLSSTKTLTTVPVIREEMSAMAPST